MKKMLFTFFVCSFLIHSPFKAQTLDNSYHQKLYYTCKVWGYLKYFHSEVAKGSFDWDDELLNIVDDVKTAHPMKALTMF